MSATASSASLKSFDFERSITGARCDTALMPLLCETNRHVGEDVRAARNCAGSGRREMMREGRAATSLYDVGIASIMQQEDRNAKNEARYDIMSIEAGRAIFYKNIQWTSNNCRPRVWSGSVIVTRSCSAVLLQPMLDDDRVNGGGGVMTEPEEDAEALDRTGHGAFGEGQPCRSSCRRCRTSRQKLMPHQTHSDL